MSTGRQADKLAKAPLQFLCLRERQAGTQPEHDRDVNRQAGTGRVVEQGVDRKVALLPFIA